MATLSTSVLLPPGLTPPLTENNDRNHNGLIVIITSLSVFLVLGSFMMRIYATYMRKVVLNDDYVLVAVVIFACTQLSVALVQVHYGWGKTAELISPSKFVHMEKTGYAADLLYMLVLGLSKSCTVVFYQNLSPRTYLWMIRVILVAIASWTVAAILLLAIRCSSDPWRDIDMQCGGLLVRWQIITSLDIALEVIILAYPISIIYKLQLPLMKKVAVLLILSSRIILIPITVVHLHFVASQIHSPDPSLTGTYATTLAELHVGLAVVLLIVSSLKPFIAVYEDEQGLAYTEDSSKSRSGGSRSKTRRSARHAMRSSIADRNMWGDRMEEPILRSMSPVVGNNRIVKSVQITVENESIELGERSVLTGRGSV